jgi:hypothetical protein
MVRPASARSAAELDELQGQWGRDVLDEAMRVAVIRAATDEDISGFLEDNLVHVQLVSIGGSDSDEVARIVGPHGHPVYRQARSSVVVVPG